MIKIDTSTNTANFRGKEYKILDKVINDSESVNITLSEHGVTYFLKSDVIIDNKPCYDSFFSKTFTLDELNKMQYYELQPTDWYFVRKVEFAIEVPEDIIQLRNAIRLKYDSLKNNL